MKTNYSCLLILLSMSMPAMAAPRKPQLKGVRRELATPIKSEDKPLPPHTAKKCLKKVKKTLAPKAVKESLPPKENSPLDGPPPKEPLPPKDTPPHKESLAPKDPLPPKEGAKEGEVGPPGWEEECVEWSTEMGKIMLDCDAVAADKGPRSTDWTSFSVNIDVLKKSGISMDQLYGSMEKELQGKVAPAVAGCSDTRRLNNDTASIVNVDFGEFEFNQQGCDSQLASASSDTSACLASDVPVSIYYVGAEPKDLSAKLESAMNSHAWNVDGLDDVSPVEVTETGRSSQPSGTSPAVYGAAALVVLGVAIGVCCYLRRRNSSQGEHKPMADTDSDSDDEKQKIPIAEAVAVGNDK